MITAQLAGRLGNQMFIIAAAQSLATDNNDRVLFTNDIQGITPTKKEIFLHRKTVLRNIDYVSHPLQTDYVHRDTDNFCYSKIKYVNSMHLVGYFQSEKYFKHNRAGILELFKPQQEILNFLLKKYSKLIDNDRYVSVHVRRGDYLNLSDYHANLGKKYYDDAMGCFSKDKVFIFFSDDIDWCKNVFSSKSNIFIEKQDDVLDLYLMSKITNNIIANSSFSWWAAWLNQNNNKKIVAPNMWFGPKNDHLSTEDLIPEEWQKI